MDLPGMDIAQYGFEDLKAIYENFAHPVMLIEVEGKDLSKTSFAVVSAEISITAGFEAGVCTLEIANVFDTGSSQFMIDDLKKIFTLGKTVEVFIGYGISVRSVFSGFISQMRFSYQEKSVPVVFVTLMDIKGVLMNGQYNKHLTAKDFSGAVKEILDKTSTKTLTENSIYELAIENTPDHKEGATGGGDGGEEVTAFSVEMVNETDYEFIVRAAKRFNYEFFCIGNQVIFRKARNTSGILMNVGPELLITDYNVEYNITGIVKNIEVRGVDPDKGEIIIGKRKLNHKVSLGNKANPLLSDSMFVLTDATITSDVDATARLDYLENEISNRFARLSVEHIGIPEMIPGRFIKIQKLTEDVSQKFYLKQVVHSFSADDGFKTRIEGVAPTISDWT